MPLRKLNDLIGKVEGFLLTFILVVMIGLAFTQVILRNFFNSGITWADVVVRHLVLWVGFIGASVASKEDGHLAMDLVSRFLPDKLRRPTAMFVHAASSFVCACLTVASYKFVMGEKEAGSMLVENIPNYWAIIIIPIGFGMMSLRFALKIFTDIKVLVKGAS
jgi:TRAP-type C4-dicarboxylate transport system permease small subunit